MSTKWTDKQILVYSHNGTQLSTENEVMIRMSNSTYKFLKHVEQKRPERTNCRIIFIWSSKTDKLS